MSLMTILEIIKIIENFAPQSLSEAWDNCGLLIGNQSTNIKKVLVSLENEREIAPPQLLIY